MYRPAGFEEMTELLGSSFRHMAAVFDSMNAFMPGDRFGMAPAMPLMPFGCPSNHSLMPIMDHGMTNMGFPNMGSPNMGSSFSSTVMTISNGPDGKPQVYKETSSTISGPGGVRETKKSVQDSRSGKKKMSIGHYIGNRGHVKEREQNVYSGDQEENEEYVNLEEEEADDFNREFEQRANMSRGGYGGGYYGAPGGQYAITDGSHRQQQSSSEYYGRTQHPPSVPMGVVEGSSGFRQPKKKSHHSKPYLKKKKTPK